MFVRVRKCSCMYTCVRIVCVCARARVRGCARACVRVCVCVCARARACVRMYVRACVCVCVSTSVCYVRIRFFSVAQVCPHWILLCVGTYWCSCESKASVLARTCGGLKKGLAYMVATWRLCHFSRQKKKRWLTIVCAEWLSEFRPARTW